MIRKILLAIVLIFLITGIGFAFQNEPDGFRALKWGDAPTEDMTLIEEWILDYDILLNNLLNLIFIQITNLPKLFYIEKDNLNIGNAKLENIFYNFNLYSNQLYRISGIFVGETNYNILKIVFEDRYGKPTNYMTTIVDGYLSEWIGDKAEVQLYYNISNNIKAENKGWFSIESTKITPEHPTDNIQKEIEKAKEDF